MKFLLSTFFILLSRGLFGQATVSGTVKDVKDKSPIEYATVYWKGSNISTETDSKGRYSIAQELGQSGTLIISRIGYQEAEIKVVVMPDGARKTINVELVPKASDLEIVVTESKIEESNVIREEVAEFLTIPSTTGNLESVLPSIALGTSSGTGGELSSQYNVRGGNYDENLVYVNDVEIFRPQLIRTGQQEGLSFPNIDLIKDLSFSSGGFESKYGDKLSSVLDIKYKRAEETKGSVGMSLLGSSAHIEGSMQLGANSYNKFRYLIGARYKTTRYILGSLDTKGEYLPDFTDVQSYLTYDITKSLQIGLLSNYNNSLYTFTPTRRSTTLGIATQSLKFTTVFEGGEKDKFTNGTNALSLTYVPERDRNPLFLKLIGSLYTSSEQENFDILGYYRLAEVESGLGAENPGREISLLGVGTQHTYTRNYLYNQIQSLSHRGGLELTIDDDRSHFLQWGVKYQNEQFEDKLNEWERIDSAGYSLPLDSTTLEFSNVLKTENNITNDKVSAFFQNSYSHRVDGSHELKVTGGVRASYRSINEELLISPRVQLLYKPLGTEKDISYKLSGGVYYQQPFYRELRRPDGTLNLDLKSQRSIHLVGGLSYNFHWRSLSNKPFRFISEVYYKKLSNLVSYEVDNVRIRYSGENDATGYVTGIDFRLNGEFVPGAESWFNLSLLSAKESLTGIQHLKYDYDNPDVPKEVKNVPRPTDQAMTLAVYFQDYLPRNENFKMFLNLAYGTGLPFGVKDNNKLYRNTYRYKGYHRVDIGFGYQLWKSQWRENKPRHPLRFAENAWLSLEVFNLLEVANVANNTWIKSITNNQFAIPNYLTSRRINLRVKFEL